MKRGHKNPLSQPAFRHGKRKNGQANKTTDFRLQQIGTWMKSADSEEINQKRLKDTRKRGANENSSDSSASSDPFSIDLQVYRFKFTSKVWRQLLRQR